MRNRLRLFPADDAVQSPSPATVTVPLAEILAPLAEAYLAKLAFVDDFANDEVQVSSDFYEVLMASVSLRKSA
jgi:hypothetical protein